MRPGYLPLGRAIAQAQSAKLLVPMRLCHMLSESTGMQAY
jgi:hypothetical protein